MPVAQNLFGFDFQLDENDDQATLYKYEGHFRHVSVSDD